MGRDRLRALGAAVVAIVLVIAGIAYWNVKGEQEKRKEAELQLGLESSKMINIIFQQRSDLVVSKLSGDVVSQVDCKGRFFNPEQTTKAPATVSYSIPLRAIKASAYSWNEDRKRLTIDIPDVRVEDPNVDISKQIVRQRGKFISRECGLVLARKTAAALTGRALTQAKMPVNMANAREAARKAVAELASGILSGAEMRGVTVAVRLPGESARTSDGERWDETRPLAEVLSQ